MPTTQQREQHHEMEQYMRETLNALIGEQVMHILGKPNGLYGVQVRQLWEGHYRVNILVGEDAVSAKVAQSFFLTADGDGNIIASAPKITKQY